MSFECWQELINDYEKLLENEKGYDVIIYEGKNKNVKEFHAHLSILSVRSQYFCTALSKEYVEKKDGKIIFKKPDISSQLFQVVLRFIYCGKIDLTKLEGPELLKLLTTVNEFNINYLIPRIEEYLIKHQLEFLKRNSVEILETVYQHESFKNLCNFCLEKICEEPENLLNSDKFINLKTPLLELLLKRDDLKLDEIVIWDSLLKWGLAQNPSISQDSTKWSKEETTIMERTLHRFIPLVRFYHMPSETFLDKVYPFKEVLPKDFVNHPPRQSREFSVIVKPKYFAIFASWIDKKEILHYNDVKNTPYNFKLLYRASKDGMNVETFHEKCDNKGANIVIGKIQNSDQIVGGYNPLFWGGENCSWNSTKDSFIFSFTNKNNSRSAKVSYVNNQDCSIYFNRDYGPAFGGGYGNGCDLKCQNDCTWKGNPSSYPVIDIPEGEFYVEDYEVFQVTKS